MEALRHHLVHHRLHMLGCGVGILALVGGAVFDLPILAISGAVVCGVVCLDMVRMTFATRLKHG
jgi:hypothetical protein